MSTTVLNQDRVKYGDYVSLEVICCYSCGVPFAIPENLRRRFKETGDSFYCPNGHSQCYATSDVDLMKQKLEKQERDFKAMLEIKDNSINYYRTQYSDQVRKTNGQKIQASIAKNKLKRVHKGVCPCCNRTFENLAQHMKTQHPETQTE